MTTRNLSRQKKTENYWQHFTSYERDNESGLDFAQARYFNSGFGRFSSPDPLLSSGRIILPASWNRYVYTLNNPLRFIDSSGFYEFDPKQQWTDDEKDAFRKNLKAARDNLKNIKKIYKKNSEEYKEAEKALKSYGCESGVNKCTDKNVVITKDSSLKDEGRAQRIDNDTRVRVSLGAVYFTSTGENPSFAAAITHEGVHVVDHFNYINSNKQVKVSDYDTERRGYVAESAMGHVMQVDVQGKENSYSSLFNPSWRKSNPNQSEIDSIRTERNKVIDKMLAGSPYNMTPRSPGSDYFQ